jgi:predicted CoA-binding protein
VTARTLKEILEQSIVVAVVGISAHRGKESHRVPAALQSIGFTIVPVHPTAREILGETVHRSVDEIPRPVDVIDVFRPPAEIPQIAREAVEIGASALWMQIGLHSAEAREIAELAGLDVVESQCMATLSAVHNINKLDSPRPVSE